MNEKFENELEALKGAVDSLEVTVSELMADKVAREAELLGTESGQYEEWLMSLSEEEAWVIEWNKQQESKK